MDKILSEVSIRSKQCLPYVPFETVLRIQVRIRIRRIRMFLGLLDPDSDPLVRGMDLGMDPDPDPSITKQK
jgi:hypothetical protein